VFRSAYEDMGTLKSDLSNEIEDFKFLIKFTDITLNATFVNWRVLRTPSLSFYYDRVCKVAEI